jgi:hypothetical protein
MMLFVCALALACRKSGDPVRETLDRIVDAASKRDAGVVVSHLAAGYRDAQDQGPTEVGAVLRRYFAAYEILNVRITGLEIERAPEAARARFRAELSGQPAKFGGLGGLLPSASRYDFDVRLVPEEGRWKVAWAAWEPAP